MDREKTRGATTTRKTAIRRKRAMLRRATILKNSRENNINKKGATIFTTTIIEIYLIKDETNISNNNHLLLLSFEFKTFSTT